MTDRTLAVRAAKAIVQHDEWDDEKRALLARTIAKGATQDERELVRFGHVLTADERRLADPGGPRDSATTEVFVKIGSITVWDAGMYDAKVLRCEAAESTFPGREGTPRFKWTLRLRSADGEEYNDVPYFTNTTMSTHVNAKLRPLVKALLPDIDLADADVVANLDTDDCVGKRCRVLLGVNEEKGQNTIDKVLPAGGATTAPAKTAPSEREEVPF